MVTDVFIKGKEMDIKQTKVCDSHREIGGIPQMSEGEEWGGMQRLVSPVVSRQTCSACQPFTTAMDRCTHYHVYEECVFA